MMLIVLCTARLLQIILCTGALCFLVGCNSTVNECASQQLYIPAIVGYNYLTSEPWHLVPLQAEKMDEVLSLPMPDPKRIKDSRSGFEIVETITGLNVQWIPELSLAEKEILRSPYRDENRGQNLKISVREYLQDFLSVSSESGFHLPENQADPTAQYFNCVVLTNSEIVIIAFPYFPEKTQLQEK